MRPQPFDRPLTHGLLFAWCLLVMHHVAAQRPVAVLVDALLLIAVIWIEAHNPADDPDF